MNQGLQHKTKSGIIKKVKILSFAMFPKNDEIYEAIKQEDFLRKVRRLLPFVIAGAVMVLGGAGVYSLVSSYRDEELYKEEKKYREIVKAVSKGDFSEASRLCKKSNFSKGFDFLKKLQQTILYRDDFFLTGSQKAWDQMKKLQDQMSKKSEAEKFTDLFFQQVNEFYGLVREVKTEQTQSVELEKVLASKDHSWHGIALCSAALKSYMGGDTSKTIEEQFYQWQKSFPAFAVWLPIYAAVGGVLRIPSFPFATEQQP